MNQNNCPVCKKTQAKYLFPAGNGELLQCQSCSLVYFTPRPTPEELSEFYNSTTYREEFQHGLMSGQSFAQARYKQLKKVINHYEPSILTLSNRHFLDIGCGTGDLLSIAASDGWNVIGTEISPVAVQEANINLHDKVLCGDMFSLDLPKKHYDIITLYHVIEHLLSPVETLARIKELLRPNGVAFIETPNINSLGAKFKGRKWSQIKPPEHITYFQPSSLQFALQRAGFSQYRVFTVSPLIIESVSKMPLFVKQTTTSIYRLAPLLGLGATLQGLALK